MIHTQDLDDGVYQREVLLPLNWKFELVKNEIETWHMTKINDDKPGLAGIVGITQYYKTVEKHTKGHLVNMYENNSLP